MAAPVGCAKHNLLQLQKSIAKDIANFKPICKQKLWMDAFVAFMEGDKDEALNQADGIECFCNEDPEWIEEADATTESHATLRLGSSWVSAPAHDVAVLQDLEDEEQLVFFCAGEDSSEPEWIETEALNEADGLESFGNGEPEWIENEEPIFYQRYLNQE